MPGREYDFPPLRPATFAWERSIAQDKVFATLSAALALRGFEARELPDGAGFVCGRWGLFRHCATLDELHAFAVRVGATC